MKIIFVSSVGTNASKNGIIPSSHDVDSTIATMDELVKFNEEAKEIAKSITGKTRDQVFVYSATPISSMQTTALLTTALDHRNLFNPDNLVYDQRINSRNYGQLEGLDMAVLDNPKLMMKKPSQAIGYIKSEMGLSALEIEPKNLYTGRLGDFLCELYFTHGDKNHTVIVIASSDVFNMLQKDDELHSVLYFGHEKPTDMGGNKKDIKTIGNGEYCEIEIGSPNYSQTTGKFIPYWEKRARENQIAILEKGKF